MGYRCTTIPVHKLYPFLKSILYLKGRNRIPITKTWEKIVLLQYKAFEYTGGLNPP